MLGSWVCFVAGLVQTGSVFLQAKPEEYRCINEIDKITEDSTFKNAHFASTSCRSFDVDWKRECPGAEYPEDFEKCSEEKDLINNETICSECSDFVYSPGNTFSETVSERILTSILNFLFYFQEYAITIKYFYIVFKFIKDSI